MAAGEDVAMIATVVTILFSLAVLGWSLLYKCTDATMDPKDFNLDKCLGFLIPPQATKKTESVSVEGENLTSKKLYETVEGEEDEEDEDEDYKFIREFNEMNTKIIGSDYTDIAARTLGECAKICYENQVNDCGGFISEYKDKTSEQDRVTCRLYPKGNLSDSTIPSYLTRSFYLKGQTVTRI